jgi:methylated-DNA-[protein]-cysteine S-methyltransferase
VTYTTLYESPLGLLLLSSDGAALTGVYMVPAAAPGSAGILLARRSEQDARAPSSAPPRSPLDAASGADGTGHDDAEPFAAAKEQLAAYFAGRLREFDLPLAPRGTPFQQQVWAGLREIPYGHTLSYGELARRIGYPAGARAVGLANGRNPISIIVPCHRVIGADGRLVGYGGGLENKQALLALEAAVAAGQASLSFLVPCVAER